MSALGRRRALLGLAGGAGLLLPAGARPLGAAPADPIRQPEAPGPAAFMRRAEEMRQAALGAGDQGFGAAVVRGGVIIGQAPSRATTARDPTAHAEVEAIRDACRRLGTADLSGAELYATFRPCPMCEAAAYWARIGRMVVGADLADRGAPSLARC